MNNALYNQIRIFQSIAREGNISAAARKLEITPPSVSNALKLLEEHIGHPLFVRTTRRIELTETGQQLLEQTAAAVDSLEKSLESLRDRNQEPSGVVRITLSRFAYLLILKPAMAAFCQQYPRIQLEISVFDGTVTGNLSTPQIAGHLNASKFVYDERSFDSLQADVTASPARVDL